MSSVSGLNEAQRATVRRLVHEAGDTLMWNASRVHYTRGPNRWQGINLKLVPPHFPDYGDCSSTCTWMLWVGLGHHFGIRDVVNGANWRSGFTGTMLTHGKEIKDYKNIDVGDCAIYGRSAPGSHVTIYMGAGKWLSHGQEAGPFLLDFRYRHDCISIKRYI